MRGHMSVGVMRRWLRLVGVQPLVLSFAENGTPVGLETLKESPPLTIALEVTKTDVRKDGVALILGNAVRESIQTQFGRISLRRRIQTPAGMPEARHLRHIGIRVNSPP